jgi:hypothetical protein
MRTWSNRPDEGIFGLFAGRRHAGHHLVDVGFEVDARPFLEFIVAGGFGLDVPHLLSELGIHDVSDVGVGDHLRVNRDVFKLVRTVRPAHGKSGQAHV